MTVAPPTASALAVVSIQRQQEEEEEAPHPKSPPPSPPMQAPTALPASRPLTCAYRGVTYQVSVSLCFGRAHFCPLFFCVVCFVVVVR